MVNYVTELKDPFRPSLSPNYYELKEATTINELLRKYGAVSEDGERLYPFVVAVDGDYKLEKDWETIVYPHNLMIVLALPPHLQGGGGGSNPLKLVLMVAVMVASIYVPQLIPGLGVFGTAALQAGIMIGGSLLVNALLPEPQISANGAYDGAQAKQLNLIGSQSNQAKSGAAIPVLYGRRRFYPDLAAQPYVEISGNEMYLHQIYLLTQGEIDLERVFIEKTPIENFDEVEYKVYQPHEKMDLFPDNVYTAPEVGDLKLDGTGDSGISTVIGYKERVSYRAINDKSGRPPSSDYWIPTYERSVTYTALTEKINFKGGYIATPLQTETDMIAIDIALPRGLAWMNDQGNPSTHRVNFIAQARLIDSSNQPAGGWFNLTKPSPDIPNNSTTIVGSSGRATETDHVSAGIWINGATIDPILQGYPFKVPKGRYEVRVGRGTKESNASRISDELKWIGLRSYMPNQHYYGDVTLLAVKIRSTNNLNNNIARRLNVIGTRIIPVFDGEKWEKQPTRSIAWASADILRNKEYGRGLKDSRINIKELSRLDRTWYGRNDFFDGYFSDQSTIWEALTRTLEVGRAKPIYIAGVINFIRNEPRIAPRQMFTPENTVIDSFESEWLFPRTGEPDHIIIEYTDPVSWQPADMVCALPGCEMIKPMRISMLPITSPQQAWREGIHRIAAHHEQREFCSWSTELEGMLISYGNEVLINYNSPEWGSTGRIEHFDGNVVCTSGELDWTGDNMIALRAMNGSVLGSYKIERLSATSGVISDLPLDDNGQPKLSNGSKCEPTHYIFGNSKKLGKRVVVTSSRHNSNNQIGLSGVLYSDFPHNAENELEMPVVVPPHDPIEEVLAVTWIKVKKSIERNVFEVSCNQARGAMNYEFEVSKGAGLSWGALYIGETPLYTGKLPFGDQIRIRARVIGTHAGEWFYWAGEVTEEEVPITKSRPGLKIEKRGNRPIYADITITGMDMGNTTNYFIEQDGIVIWTGVLLRDQEATITRQFDPEVIIDPEEVPAEVQVEFKAYAIDNMGDRSESAIGYMIY